RRNARRATDELETSRCTAISPWPRRWRLPAVWKSADSSARRSQRRVGAIDASSFRISSELHIASERDAFELEQRPLETAPERPVRPGPRGRHDAVARDHERDAVVRAERAGGALGVRVARERGQFAIADDLAVRQHAQHLGDGLLKGRAPLEVELD